MNKKEYAKLVYTDEKMQKIIESNTFDVIDLERGPLAIDKHTINKNFCFGYGMYGISDDEDMKRADRMAEAAKTKDYFVEKNLKDINSSIETLQKAIDNDDLFKSHYSYCSVLLLNRYYGDTTVIGWCIADSRDVEGTITKESICKSKNNREDVKYTLPTKEDLVKILNGYKSLKDNTIKRLDTWWKKYGASKLNTWTYLVD